MITEKDLKRFWDKVDRRGQDECWPWLASKDIGGYGQFSYEGKAYKAHRFAWMIEHGEIPEGMLCCHKCDNPACVNFLHIFISDQAGNMADMVKKGRTSKHMIGKKHSLETRKKISMIQTGGHRNLGIKLSEQHKEKIRARMMGNKHALRVKKIDLICKNCNKHFIGITWQLFCCTSCRRKSEYIQKKNKINLIQ